VALFPLETGPPGMVTTENTRELNAHWAVTGTTGIVLSKKGMVPGTSKSLSINLKKTFSA